MNDLSIGQQVTVEVGVPGVPQRIAKVVEIGKLKVKLDDGSTWRANDGYSWGTVRGHFRYGSLHIRETRQTDQEAIDRARYTSFLTQNGIWDKVPLDVLEDIAKRVNSIKAR